MLLVALPEREDPPPAGLGEERLELDPDPVDELVDMRG